MLLVPLLFQSFYPIIDLWHHQIPCLDRISCNRLPRDQIQVCATWIPHTSKRYLTADENLRCVCEGERRRPGLSLRLRPRLASPNRCKQPCLCLYMKQAWSRGECVCQPGRSLAYHPTTKTRWCLCARSEPDPLIGCTNMTKHAI